MNYTIVIDYQKDFIDGSLYNEEAIKIRKCNQEDKRRYFK